MATKKKAAAAKPQKDNTLQLGNATVNMQTVKDAKNVYRALTHKIRLQILGLIDKAQGGTNVTSIYKKLKIEQSVASQHLAILRRAGLVNSSTKGKERIYIINYSKLQTLDSVSAELTK